METAIKKAIEGGWFIDGEKVNSFTSNEVRCRLSLSNDKAAYLTLSEIRELPSFWQALGKALGWNMGMVQEYYKDRIGGVDRDYDSFGQDEIEEWQYHWHRFIDHLAEDKDADSFFEKLIP